MSQAAPALAPRRRNRVLFAGVAFLFLTILSNVVPSLYTLKIPGLETVLPWVSLLLPVIALVCFAIGLKRAFSQPEIYRGRVSGSILGVVSLLLIAASTWFFIHLRDLPASSGAPRIGQKAPDFTLSDTSGNQVSLSELLKTPIDAASGKAPKGVLLIFYRGYW
jgi:hypothetical protein